MKFAKQLSLRIIPEWSENYLNYKDLKKEIKAIYIKIEALGPAEKKAEVSRFASSFRDSIEKEVDKVNRWYNHNETSCIKMLETLQEKWAKDISKDEKDAWMNSMNKLLLSLEKLIEFTRANITGFEKILKKFDKWMQGKITEELWPIITNTRFVKSERDEILLTQAKLLWRKRVPASTMSLLEGEEFPPPTAENNIVEAPDPNVPTSNILDLDSFPWGRISRLWVTLAEDGLSSPIRVPVIIAKGVKKGPVVGITAALHGNELNGIPLIHRLFRELKCHELHGILVAVPVANAPGYLRCQREFSDGSDLNRLFPGKKYGQTAQVYAFNLLERIASKFDYLLDLHTASRGRVNSLYVRADMINPRTRRMAILQNPQIIVHNTSPDGSLRGAVMEQSIPAITVEIGDPSRVQKRFVKHALLGVTNILSNLKMIPNEPDLPEYDPVVCARSYWIFATGGGILNVLPDVNTWVKKGEAIAYLYSVFGWLEKTYYATEDGIVIGKSVDPVCQSGDRILHLGVVENQFPAQVNDGHL